VRRTMMIAVASIFEIVRGDAQKPAKPARVVQVCLRDLANTDVVIRYQAQSLAARLYKGAGVTIDWSCKEVAVTCSLPPIVIELRGNTPETDNPGALARAFAYEGTHIVVYYDRIQHIGSSLLTPALLGHVLAHELMHVLQRTDQHSDRGVMKARWTWQDYAEMLQKPLVFTEENLVALRISLAQRAPCTDGAGNQ